MKPDEALQILELSAPITRASLKTAYRDALMVWHPDRFEGNKDLRAKAEIRTYQINEAYAFLKAVPESAYPFKPKAGSQESRSMPPPQAAAAAPPPPPPPPPPWAAPPPPQATTPAPDHRPKEETSAWLVAAAVVFLIVLIVNVLSPRQTAHKAVLPALAANASIIEIRSRAEQGEKEAQFRLGGCYNEGVGVSRDDVEAVKWYRKAAEQGYAASECELGVCYQLGLGVPKDEVEGVKWISKAANQGYAVAQSCLGICYGKGEGVLQDDVEAVKWFRIAAEQGKPTRRIDWEAVTMRELVSQETR